MKTQKENDWAVSALRDAAYLRNRIAEMPKEYRWLVPYAFSGGTRFGLQWGQQDVGATAFNEVHAMLREGVDGE